MNALQWAVLIFGAAAVVAVYWFSRRDKRAMDRADPAHPEAMLPTAKDRQLDIFGGPNQQFDEFGVGKPRRVAPNIGEQNGAAGVEPATEPKTERAPRIGATPATRPREKIISLLIAEKEGTHIRGALLHKALRGQGLEFGARQIYHRLQGGEAVFSVASLLKPGVLDPATAQEFTTPGLTLFMILPGPRNPVDAVRDMLDTANGLSAELNAEVFDAKREPLTRAAERRLIAEVEAWAKAGA
jgi:cell division protein ZipA